MWPLTEHIFLPICDVEGHGDSVHAFPIGFSFLAFHLSLWIIFIFFFYHPGTASHPTVCIQSVSIRGLDNPGFKLHLLQGALPLHLLRICFDRPATVTSEERNVRDDAGEWAV